MHANEHGFCNTLDFAFDSVLIWFNFIRAPALPSVLAMT